MQNSMKQGKLRTIGMGHWLGGRWLPTEPGQSCMHASTQLARHNVTAGSWQSAWWTAPPVRPGGQAELAF